MSRDEDCFCVTAPETLCLLEPQNDNFSAIFISNYEGPVLRRHKRSLRGGRLRPGVCYGRRREVVAELKHTGCQSYLSIDDIDRLRLHKGCTKETDPDSKVHGANVGPIWGRQDPGGPHVGHTNFAIWRRIGQGEWKVFNRTHLLRDGTVHTLRNHGNASASSLPHLSNRWASDVLGDSTRLFWTRSKTTVIIAPMSMSGYSAYNLWTAKPVGRPSLSLQQRPGQFYGRTNEVQGSQVLNRGGNYRCRNSHFNSLALGNLDKSLGTYFSR